VVFCVSTVVPEEPELDGDMTRCATKANTEMTTISAIHPSTRPTTNRPRMLSGHHFLFIGPQSMPDRSGEGRLE
jgi:hypothetical protein